MRIKNYDEVESSILSKVKVTKCPVCQSESLQLDPLEYYRVSYNREGGQVDTLVNPPTDVIPYVTLKCHHCGYSMDFDYRFVMDDMEYPDR